MILTFLSPATIRTTPGSMVQNKQSVQTILESKIVDPAKEDAGQKILAAIAYAIVHNPEQVKKLLQDNNATVSANATKLDLKNALIQKLAENSSQFKNQLAALISPNVRVSNYSNLFGIDDIVSFITTLGSSSSSQKIDTQLTNNLIQIQQEKEKTQRQQELIGFGIFGLILLTTTIIVLKTKK